jgi:hypothetical protein
MERVKKSVIEVGVNGGNHAGGLSGLPETTPVAVAVDLARNNLVLMRVLTAMGPSRIFTEVQHCNHIHHPDLHLCFLHFPDNIFASLVINWLTQSKIRMLPASCDRSLFKVVNFAKDLHLLKMPNQITCYV